jgi:hypothetical protein
VFFDDLQARLRLFAAVTRDQDAVALVLAASDPAR